MLWDLKLLFVPVLLNDLLNALQLCHYCLTKLSATKTDFTGTIKEFEKEYLDALALLTRFAPLLSDHTFPYISNTPPAVVKGTVIYPPVSIHPSIATKDEQGVSSSSE